MPNSIHKRNALVLVVAFVFSLAWQSPPVLGQARGAKTNLPTGGLGRRMALVLGNKAYKYANKLQNPVNDANDMAVALKQLGFEVSPPTIDADYRTTIAAINDFVAKLQPDDVVILYYSGHGIGYNGKNYILPTDANITCIERIDEHGISIGRIQSDFEQKHVRTSLLFLDACRNMPTLKACQSNTKDLSAPGGMVRPANTPHGSMMIFATEEGTTADDNLTGRNGLFTGELLKYLTLPGLGIRAIIDSTIAGVMTRTNGFQSPARYDKLWGDFVFLNTPVTKGSVTTNPAPNPKPYTPRPAPTGNYIPVKASVFRMGAANRPYNEQPVHEVQVSDFYMARFEVTISEWQAFCKAQQRPMPTIPDVETPDSYWRDKGRFPITNITWFEAVEYANWLSEQQGLLKAYRIDDYNVDWDRSANGYRLPTEAEWEMAARGHTPDLPFAGSRIEQEVSWSQENSNDNTHPVGGKKPNDLNLHDLTGNVWEWCWDWYDEYYYRRSEKANPAGVATGTMRSIRGGSWLTAINNITIRRGRSPRTQSTEIGFRLVRSNN